MIAQFDKYIISFLRRITPAASRIALFVVFFWFGILKLIGTSPANPLVEQLQQATLPFLTFSQFIFCFGVYEMLIGIAFIIPRWERLAIALLIPHMITTFMPLVLLPSITWQGFLTPTLEGQYIIKNLVIIALAFSLSSQLKPFEQQ
jgi:uncharacterized membrane protein YkgB